MKCRNVRIVSLSCLLLFQSFMNGDCSYPRSIYVPRQLTFNPLLENSSALCMHTKQGGCKFLFAIDPVYRQNVGGRWKRYFTINHKEVLNVQENGSGDINPIWFKASDNSMDGIYNSKLSFHPKLQTYGSYLYAALKCCKRFYATVASALIATRTKMEIRECNIHGQGTMPAYPTITASLAHSDRLFGRVCGGHTQFGLDDIQVKVGCTLLKGKKMGGDLYFLGGIPTGRGSKARNLFEPLVGSKHGQIGAGATVHFTLKETYSSKWSLLSEVKYRYGFKNDEFRSFDLKKNGQWSRYMLLVNQTDLTATMHAINNLTFNVGVTPRSSCDLYLATEYERSSWNMGFGYDFWYRQSEKISLGCPDITGCPSIAHLGLADLKSIAIEGVPTTASTATISQSISAGSNQMVSDATVVLLTVNDINTCSGAVASSSSHSFFAHVGRTFKSDHADVTLQINGAYELGTSVNAPDTVMAWLNIKCAF